MKNKFIILLLALIIVTISAISFLYRPASPAPEKSLVPQQITLFYGDGCEHCQKVADFIGHNNITAKINISQLEIYNNQTNAAIFLATAKFCDDRSLTVPMLWDGQSCLYGDTDIINYFKNKVK